MKQIKGTISDVRVEENIAYVKVSSNGRSVGSEVSNKTDSLKHPKSKVLKADQNAASSIKTERDYVGLIGSKDNRVLSSKSFGNFIVGATTFTSHPEQIRIGGVYRFNGHLTSIMPSTIVTPIPVLQFDFPLESTLKGLSKILKEYQGMLGEFL